MYPIEKPESYRAAMLVARDATRVDTRTEFEVYLDVSRKVARLELAPTLDIVPLDEVHKKQAIEARAFARAQAAHLSDNGRQPEDKVGRQPVQLLTLLEQLDSFTPKTE
nr:hypothetical protein [Nitrosomonas nitrosa]